MKRKNMLILASLLTVVMFIVGGAIWIFGKDPTYSARAWVADPNQSSLVSAEIVENPQTIAKDRVLGRVRVNFAPTVGRMTAEVTSGPITAEFDGSGYFGFVAKSETGTVLYCEWDFEAPIAETYTDYVCALP